MLRVTHSRHFIQYVINLRKSVPSARVVYNRAKFKSIKLQRTIISVL